jgi:acetyl esterase/lipase
VADVTDLAVPGFQDGPAVPVRRDTPAEAGPYPTLAFFHGGGFLVGDVETHDLVCRYLTSETGAQVVSVDYRLAPEDPFPAALEDCYAATEWAAGAPDDLDATGELAVIGDSAGGNLAAAVSLMARDLDGPDLDAQVLIYPAVARSEDWPSMRKFAQGYSSSPRTWSGSPSPPSPTPSTRQPRRQPARVEDPRRPAAGDDPDRGLRPAARPGPRLCRGPRGRRRRRHLRERRRDDSRLLSMLEGLAEFDDAHAALGVVGDDLEAAWS